MVDEINFQDQQYHSRNTPYNKDWKHLDLFDRKAYSSASLQFRIGNYQALLAKYDYINYNRLSDFNEKLPESSWYTFKAIVQEGQLVAKIVLQSALDAADTTARTISMAVVIR